jgi:aconitate hydratase
VLTVTEMLRKKGVVGKFVEFFGPGLDEPAARRPRDHRQHGAGIRRDLRLLPDRRRDARYLASPAATKERVALVEAYAKAQGMWRDETSPDPGLHRHARTRPGDTVEPSARRPEAPAGPRALRREGEIREALKRSGRRRAKRRRENAHRRRPVEGEQLREVDHGDVVIAAITSCTNTSNPSVLIAAGLSRARRGARA